MKKTRIARSASFSLTLMLLVAASAPAPAPAGASSPAPTTVLTAEDIAKAKPATSIPPVSSDPDDQPPAGAGALQGMAAPNASCDSKPPGVERWKVKTSLKDAAPATALNDAMASPVGIADFMKAKNIGKIAKAVAKDRIKGPVTIGSTTAQEGDYVAVTGFVRSIGCEGDGDFHINISTSRSVTTCAVVEVPNPSQLAPSSSSAFVKKNATAIRTTLAKMFAAAGSNKAAFPKVTFAGQLFYDGTHFTSTNPGGGRGAQLKKGTPCATTLWELHPALLIRIEQG